jgi:DNA-binding NarL/FixJ family response regulator
VRVLLVDDHKMVREGIAGLLENEPDIVVAGEAADGESAVKLAGQTQPDVVVMDVALPGMNGIEATRQITRKWPHVRVIALSTHGVDEMASAMLSAGAVAFMTKGGPVEDLMAAIRGQLEAPGPH